MGNLSARLPLARSEGLLVEQVGDETVILNTESKEAHCLSPLAAAVFAGADGRTSVEDIAELVSSDEPVTVEQVDAALAQLDERGLLDRPALPAAPQSGLSRRQLVRRTAGATAAISAVPLVTSIATPAFAQGSPGLGCPAAICASQSDGDDFCACVNDCPGGTDSRCARFGTAVGTGPYLDSCECLNCSELTAAGRPDLCVQNPQQCPPGSTPENPGPGGCSDPSKFLDGRCFKIGGDSSEPCPTVN